MTLDDLHILAALPVSATTPAMLERPSRIPPDYIEIVFDIVKEFAGWRLDRFIAHRIPRLSRTRIQRIIKSCVFDETGQLLRPNRTLKCGEQIYLYKIPPDEPEVCRQFSVLYEDDWFLAVDKPPLLPVHPTARYYKNTLTALLDETYGDAAPRLVHRIDSETSGIVLCARTLEAERLAKAMFAARNVRKQYVAVVRGIVAPPSGRIEAPLTHNPHSFIKARMWCGDPEGLPSLTEYSTIARMHDRTFILLKPRTGRQHQLRVHLDHIGHPIIGDKLYGPDETLFIDYMSDGLTPQIIERAGHRRQALHAATLEFTHPFTKEQLLIESPIPDDFRELFTSPIDDWRYHSCVTEPEST
jgi:23S rRNA pseudouridine1911/1915/1917 synthase